MMNFGGGNVIVGVWMKKYWDLKKTNPTPTMIGKKWLTVITVR